MIQLSTQTYGSERINSPEKHTYTKLQRNGLESKEPKPFLLREYRMSRLGIYQAVNITA